MTPTELLHPEIAAAVQLIPFDAITANLLPTVRAASLAVPMPLSDDVERTDHTVPGDPPVPVRVHRAKGAAGARPCVYSIQGGGYVIGSYAMDDPLFDRLCPELGVVGVSVEYPRRPRRRIPDRSRTATPA